MKYACILAVLVCSTQSNAATLGLQVSGNHLLDANGDELVLHGVNVSGLEFAPMYGDINPWGSMEPDWAAIAGWKANVVRLPLNEASWLGLQTIDTLRVKRNADPGGNYRQTVRASVAAANAHGLYVILDLHIGAPGLSSPMVQTQMADADNSLNFWRSIASTFKSNPAVLFELYNEPYGLGNDPWGTLMAGGTLSSFLAASTHYNYQNVFIVSIPNASAPFVPGETVMEGNASAVVNQWDAKTQRLFIQAPDGSIFESSPFTAGGMITGMTSGASGAVANPSLGWNVAGMQTMIDVVRSTGATNVILVGSQQYSNNLAGWLAHRPVDPLNQLACSWHAYPPEQTVQNAGVAVAGSGYSINDTIKLPQPNTVYNPAQLMVTSVGQGGGISGVGIQTGGSYLETRLPTNPEAQGSTSGGGNGATFTLDFSDLSATWSMPENWPTVRAIATQIPVLITETGEHNALGTKGAPFLSHLLPWADKNGISYLGWTWDVWGGSDGVLIRNVKGEPTDGYGQYFRRHLKSLQ